MKYNDYIIMEIAQNLKECAVEAKLNHHYFRTPLEPIIKEVSRTSASESNYAVGPLTKTVFVSDAFGNRYKVSVEDLKNVKGKGWITHEEFNKLPVSPVWNREEEIYEVA